MTEAQLLDLIAGGERTGVEFKGPRRRDEPSFVEVIKAALGLVNRQDPGYIIIGVRNDGVALGLAPEQAKTWGDPDLVRQLLLPCGDPPIEISVDVIEVRSAKDLAGRTFAAITVHPFERIPVFCRVNREHPKGVAYLKKGACYVRGLGLPSTTELAGGEELRELLRVAISRGVHDFLSTARAASIPLEATGPTDIEQFESQERLLDE